MKIWKVHTKELTRVLRFTNAVYGVAFSPDGQWLAAGGDDEEVIVWKTNDWDNKKILKGHIGRIRAVAFNPMGTEYWLASAGDDHSVKIWPKQ